MNNGTIKNTVKSLLAALIVLCVIASAAVLSACDSCGQSLVVDDSERKFNVIHCSGLNNAYRQLTISNEDGRIVYADGNCLYDYSTKEKIDDVRGEIRVLSLSKSYLYVLYEDNDLYVYDIASGYENIECEHDIDYISNFGDIAVKTMVDYVAMCYYEDDPENFFYLSDIICSGQKYGETGGDANMYLSYIDGIPIYSDRTYDDGYPLQAYHDLYAFINGQPLSLDGWNISSGSRTYFRDDLFYVNRGYVTVHKKGGGSYGYSEMNNSHYLTSENNVFYSGKWVYELIQRPDYKNGEWGHPPYRYNFPQYLTVNDRLIANDLEKASGHVVYQTENNLTRIVGFNGKTIYLFDVGNYTLSALDIPDILANESVEIKKLPEEDELSFEWCADVLFVYDGNFNVVDIIET